MTRQMTIRRVMVACGLMGLWLPLACNRDSEPPPRFADEESGSGIPIRVLGHAGDPAMLGQAPPLPDVGSKPGEGSPPVADEPSAAAEPAASAEPASPKAQPDQPKPPSAEPKKVAEQPKPAPRTPPRPAPPRRERQRDDVDGVISSPILPPGG
jgi:hypothetical protein